MCVCVCVCVSVCVCMRACMCVCLILLCCVDPDPHTVYISRQQIKFNVMIFLVDAITLHFNQKRGKGLCISSHNTEPDNMESLRDLCVLKWDWSSYRFHQRLSSLAACICLIKKMSRKNIVTAETENKLIYIPRSEVIYRLLNHLHQEICIILNIFGRCQTFIAFTESPLFMNSFKWKPNENTVNKRGWAVFPWYKYSCL